MELCLDQPKIVEGFVLAPTKETIVTRGIRHILKGMLILMMMGTRDSFLWG
jgi:hypothetical protein